jgi:hypothetical protein
MTDREKLIDLLMGFRIVETIGKHVDMRGAMEQCADHLIAHGVTVRDPQKPLTVEEVLISRYQIPCWIERNENGCVSIVADVLDRSDYDRFFGQVDANMMRQGLVDHMTRYRAESYGKTWRCWAEKPTYEERKAAEWK